MRMSDPSQVGFFGAQAASKFNPLSRRVRLRAPTLGAPNSNYRALITPASRGKRKKHHPADKADQTPAEKRVSITWAKRLNRVFKIDIETCDKCGGDVRIISSIASRYLLLAKTRQ